MLTEGYEQSGDGWTPVVPKEFLDLIKDQKLTPDEIAILVVGQSTIAALQRMVERGLIPLVEVSDDPA